MPGCSPLQVIAISHHVAARLPQEIENMEVSSSRRRWRTAAVRGELCQPAPSHPADLAGRNRVVAWQARYLEWMETGLSRSSTGLLARLPFGDAVKVAVLVGTGRMTWPEINAALDAMIKVAAADALDGMWIEDDTAPTQDPAKRISEDEIWARYHAQCDEVFVNDASPMDTGAWSREQLWRTEQILNRLRSARDRDLAALRRRLGSQPSQTAMPGVGLSPAESAAMGKLNATGFVGSEGMMAAIDSLVSEIAKSAAPLNAACAAAPACRA